MTTVIGCYSEGTPYEAEAELLRASLDAVGMAYEIRGFADRGDWYANTRMKAEMIRAFRHDLAGPLLYVDVDAFVHRDCSLYFDGLARDGYDYGAHWFAGPAKGMNRAKVRRDRRGHLVGWWMLSGTLFWGDTPGARRLLDAWVAMNDTLAAYGAPQGGGQKNLWFLVTAHFKNLKVCKLPGRYCYVFDKPWAYPEGEPRVIEHTLASRDHRAEERRTPERAARIDELRGGA